MLIFEKNLALCMIYWFIYLAIIWERSSAKDQIMFLWTITALKAIILSIKTDIIDQCEEENKKIFAKQENVLSNAEMLLKKEES